MKSFSISGSPRANVGRRDARDLRNAGMVPCVVYGGKEQLYFSIHENQLTKLIYTPDVFVVKIDIAGKQVDTIIQEIQFHKVNDKLQHIDFLEVVAGKPVTVNIPVKLTGTAIGVKEGGRLLNKMKTIKTRGPIEKMPDNVTLNIEALNIGDSIRVSDIKLEGIKLLEAPKNTVVGVRITRNVVEEAAPVLATTAVAAGAAPAAGAPAAAGAVAPAAGAAAKKPDAKK